MPNAFTNRTSTLRGGDTLRFNPGGSPPLYYRLDIENTAEPAADAFPTMLVQVAFDSDPLEGVPQWTDLTRYCKAVSFTRGRSFELDEVVAGNATFVFNNLDRTLDPTFTDGPYYGKLTTRRRIRFSAVWGTKTYARFDGFVNSWPQTANDPSRRYAEVSLTATDLFGILAQNKIRTVTPMITDDVVFGRTNGPYKTGGQLQFPTDESCRARIDHICDLWPLPAQMRAIDTGLTFLAAGPPGDSETSLGYLQRIAVSETGRLYVSRKGVLTFEERDHWQTDPRELGAQVLLSDTATPSYSAIQVDPADDRYLRNRIVRGREGQTPLVAQDLQSILTHGEIEDSHTDCVSKFQDDLRAQVKWLLGKFVDQKERFSSVTLLPQRFPEQLFPFVLASDLGNRVNLSYQQTAVGTPMVGDYWIEQITESVSVVPQSYQVVLGLSPVDTDVY